MKNPIEIRMISATDWGLFVYDILKYTGTYDECQARADQE